MNNENSTSFFKELAKYYRNENDLSNITVALCNSNTSFCKKFLHYFFPDLPLGDVKLIKREVRDLSGMGSRVDIFIFMKNNERYIIEVKINDQNHHFGQYDSAYEVDKSHFGYITNYYCAYGISKGYLVKTWKDFYHYMIQNKSELDNAQSGYLDYVADICNIKTYNSKMDFSNLKTIPQFFQFMEEIVEKESENLKISPYTGAKNEKMSDLNWHWRYFNINDCENQSWLLNGIILLSFYDATTISIGISQGVGINLEQVEEDLSHQNFEYTEAPYIDKEWWNYLWFNLKKNMMDKLNAEDSPEKQNQLLTSFLTEVIGLIRNYLDN